MNACCSYRLLRSSAFVAAATLALFVSSLCATDQPAPTARDEELLAWSKDSAKVRLGKRLYAATCLQCHGDEKNGVDAPSNLFDTKWYHGSTPSKIEQNIAAGLLEKGMPAWRDALAGNDIAALTAYLLNRQPSPQAP
ncbi:MAG TPA: cytochrome c [Opitutaceae bacterium]|nr:cytochrome c [Opitutaceae bacterium]